MPSRVILHVHKGRLTKDRFEFEERMPIVAGRHPNNNLVTPESSTTVSRRHCLLDINPPNVCVRDMGSLHGTFVNGRLIGRREPHETAEEGQKRVFTAYPLENGDRLQLAAHGGEYAVELVVEKVVVPVCYECGEEIPDNHLAEYESQPDRFQCGLCRSRKVVSSGQEPGIDRPSAEWGREPGHLPKESPYPEMLDGYEVLDLLGRGGCGAVYRALHRATGRVIALKVMRPEVAVNRRARLAFDRERVNLQQLDHPNIVRIRSTDQVGGVYYFDMELCSEGSIAAQMSERNSVLSTPEAVDLTRQLLIGLEYAHQAPIPNVLCDDGQWRAGVGLVHRDLKPGNLLLHRDGVHLQLKIGDFGLAKAFDLAGMSAMTMVSDRAGTPKYLCKQQVIDFRSALPEVDVWAAAACLYSMLTGCVPKRFGAGLDPWVVAADGVAVPIQDRRREQRLPALPQPLAEVVDAALQDQGVLLHTSARSLLDALDRAMPPA